MSKDNGVKDEDDIHFKKIISNIPNQIEFNFDGCNKKEKYLLYIG